MDIWWFIGFKQSYNICEVNYDRDCSTDQGSLAIHSRKVGDIPSANLYEKLMEDEEDHIDFLETQLDLYETIGEQNYGALNAVSALDADA